jgi:hypothetical protein
VKTESALLLSRMRMVKLKEDAENCTPLIHHLLKVKNGTSLPILFNHVCFEFVPIYVSSHFSIALSVAFRKIAQAGGGVQVAGELWCCGVVRCCRLTLLFFVEY